MQVLQLIVQRVAVNMVHDLPRLGIRNLAMFPFSATSLGAVTQSLGGKVSRVGFVGFFSGSQLSAHGSKGFGCWRDHFVSAAHVLARRKRLNLLGIGIQGVAVSVPHLVMPNAKLPGGDGPITVQTCAANFLAAPLVFRSPMLFYSLVVHQAKAMSRMFSTAIFDSAKWHSLFPIDCTHLTGFKFLGNSWAVPCARWIGERIEAVERIRIAQAATKTRAVAA